MRGAISGYELVSAVATPTSSTKATKMMAAIRVHLVSVASAELVPFLFRNDSEEPPEIAPPSAEVLPCCISTMTITTMEATINTTPPTTSHMLMCLLFLQLKNVKNLPARGKAPRFFIYYSIAYRPENCKVFPHTAHGTDSYDKTEPLRAAFGGGCETMNTKTFAVIGGDLRQAHLAGLLARDGYPVLAVGFERKDGLSPDVLQVKQAQEAAARADCVVLPLPFSVDGQSVNAPFSRAPIPLESLWRALRPHTFVTGGMFTPAVRWAAENYGFRAADYYAEEELAVRNTVPTAEGAIQIALEQLPVTLHGARCLVLGFGRVGKTLCRALSGLGAHVTGAARSYEDLAWMRALGCAPLHLDELPGAANAFDAVFNTIPAVILRREILAKFRQDVLIIDLASRPGGVDFEAATELGLHTVWALSLPGKVAPHTAGRFIKETVLHMLAREGLQ